jgi:trehalose synthase
LWRSHIDLSAPNEELWAFLKEFLIRYDAIIISNEKYKKTDLLLRQRVILPAIDPLSPKNMEISQGVISKYLKKFHVPTDKPFITQISRFDKWKDPEGVIEIFRLIKEKVDCRLVLCGSMAMDDPGGSVIYEKVMRKARRLIKNGDVILITHENSILVNALQRSAAVVTQNSFREGFGLTVTEALWKRTPVVASRIGGIPLQITDGENGFLASPCDTQDFADKIIHILQNPDLAEDMGSKGKRIVRENFLITRLLSDYIDLLKESFE